MKRNENNFVDCIVCNRQCEKKKFFFNTQTNSFLYLNWYFLNSEKINGSRHLPSQS